MMILRQKKADEVRHQQGERVSERERERCPEGSVK